MTCGECKHQKECLEYFGDECGCLYGFEPKIMTNFENVTASPEALARFINIKINQTKIYNICPFSLEGSCPVDIGCDECIAKWLKQEAKETDNE